MALGAASLPGGAREAFPVTAYALRAYAVTGKVTSGHDMHTTVHSLYNSITLSSGMRCESMISSLSSLFRYKSVKINKILS
jgi:hypothetical protein